MAGFFKSKAFKGLLMGLPFGIIGAAVGASVGSANDAKKRQRTEYAAALGQQQAAEAQASRMALAQVAERDKALKKISAGRARAARGRVRGGLFGDAASGENYAAAARLGG